MKKIDVRACEKILPNGMPEGYEFVRVGFAKQGEFYLGSGDENCKVIVRKIDPKPKYTLWTFETCALGTAVKAKTGSMLGIVSTTYGNGAMIGGNVWTWDEIFRDFTQLDGTPCGTIET